MKKKMKKAIAMFFAVLLGVAMMVVPAMASVNTSGFTSGPLSSKLFKPCDQQGTLEEFSYKTDYGSREITKTCKVYLPYGYSPNEHYNVVLFIHGLNGTHNTFFTDVKNVNGIRMVGRDLYDNMIATGHINPTIFVGMDTAYHGADMPSKVLGTEIREHIIPEVVSRYATWAKSPAIEDIVAAREHFAVFGQSNGSLRVYDTCIVPNMDMFASFACISGTYDEDEGYLLGALNEKYPVKLLFLGAGNIEGHARKTTAIFNDTMTKTDQLEEGENAILYIVDGHHNWATWFAQLYNFLPLVD